MTSAASSGICAEERRESLGQAGDARGEVDGGADVVALAVKRLAHDVRKALHDLRRERSGSSSGWVVTLLTSEDHFRRQSDQLPVPGRA